MTSQNINEIYAVIEVVDGKEIGIMSNGENWMLPYLYTEVYPSWTDKDKEGVLDFLKKIAKKILTERKAEAERGNFSNEYSGLLVKFTNREVISVFGGEI